MALLYQLPALADSERVPQGAALPLSYAGGNEIIRFQSAYELLALPLGYAGMT